MKTENPTLTAALALTDRQRSALYSELNHRGRSMAPDDGMNINDACESANWAVHHESSRDDEVAIAETPEGRIYLVGDSTGPWAVRLDPDDAQTARMLAGGPAELPGDDGCDCNRDAGSPVHDADCRSGLGSTTADD